MTGTSNQKNLKKSIALSLALLCILLGFTGCGNQPSAKSGPELYQTLSAEAATKLKFAEKLAEVDKETTCLTYGLELSQVSEAMMLVGSGAYVDEFAIFLASDGTKAEALKAKAEERVAFQKKLYTNYNPQELPKLEQPLLFVKDNLVVLCIGGEKETTDYLKSVLK